jgi:hypothetical protein
LKPLLQQAEPPGLLPWEQMFRDALLATGRQLFEPMLQQRIDQIDRAYQPGPKYRFMGRRPLILATLFGDVRIQRDYYVVAGDSGHCPADATLGLEGSATPALARLITRAAAQQPYGAASRDLAEYGAIEVDERQIQRVVQRISPDVEPWLARLPSSSLALPVLYVSCDGTGTPMRREELVGRKGKQADGSAKTREVKLGAVFTQHRVDDEGRPIRDHESTTYVASYAPAADFSLLLRAEARRRGVGSAAQVVFLSDGAAWAEEIGAECFTGCVSILDFYHACERLHELAEALDPTQAKARLSRWKRLLFRDRIGTVIEQARAWQGQRSADPETVAEHLGFLERHQHRMRYGSYRRQGWFIGSGVVEAGCKTVVGKRLKQSGMFWSEPGATGVLNFRTILLSRRFDDFWRDRASDHAARNDVLSLTS